MRLEVLSRLPQHDDGRPPLLFVHGAWHGAWCWDEHFLPYFAEHGWPAYALSLRGHGNSEGRDKLRWTRIGDYVDDVAQVADTLPRRPVVIGHSMGGCVVQRYLEDHDAPAAAILASVPPAGVLPTVLRLIRRHPLTFLQMNLRLSLWPMVDAPHKAREHFFSPDLPAADLDRYAAKLQDESYLGFLDMLAFARPRPARVRRVPLLVLGAEQDTVFLSQQVRDTARAYDVEPQLIDGLAHDVMLDTRWREAADGLRAWLDVHTGPASAARS
ncbi:MAG: alpha/beta fold hydrolase [Pseudomonadota bacterium]|nr:alpha/beta fold hydrolase [Pseudomonadota bacterium]